jgi:hypothetical protein
MKIWVMIDDNFPLELDAEGTKLYEAAEAELREAKYVDVAWLALQKYLAERIVIRPEDIGLTWRDGE